MTAHIPTSSAAVSPGLYLLVKLSGELYALPAMEVRELVRWTSCTRVPAAPQALRGVINLRGRVVPLFDLSACLDTPTVEPGETSVVVVAQRPHEAPAQAVAFLVEEVLETVRITAAQMETLEVSGAARDLTPCCATVGGRVLFLVSLDRLLTRLARAQGEAP